MIKGIDISEHNGVIDFAKVKNAGYKFVIIRLGWIGNKNNHTLDKYFKDNYFNAKFAGLKIGLYVYSYVETSTAMENAISWVKENISGLSLDYPIFLDLEDKQLNNISKDNLTSLAKQFCNSFENSGVYANKNWFTNKLNVQDLLNYKIWLAEYNNKNNYTVNFKVDMWQYTSSGKVDGIKGNVDLNNCYNCKDNNEVNINEMEGFEVKSWKNGTRNETVYSDLACTKSIGVIYPGEYADCY